MTEHRAWILIDPDQDYEELPTVLGVYGTDKARAPDHAWGNPEDCPGCHYSKAVVERQTWPDLSNG